jgi:hypothetical protein
MEMKLHAGFVWIEIQMIHTPGIERRRSAFHPVNLVAFREQQFCEIGTILPRDTSDKSDVPGHPITPTIMSARPEGRPV